MPRVIRRRRGTAIVETDMGILLTSGNGRIFILPGGGAKRGETRIEATLRELIEETRLKPYLVGIIFGHLGKVKPTMSGRGCYQDHHTVCLVKATGKAIPGSRDVKHIAYYYPGCNVRVSMTTQEIIDKYYLWKLKKERNTDNPVTNVTSPKERPLLWRRFINNIQSLRGKKDIYLIGDTHFDHANIIRFCRRPFPNVWAMNWTLVKNWNNVVSPKDTVYFLGDWAFGRGSRSARYWMKNLNGHKVSIKGGHDTGPRVRGMKLYKSKILNYGGYKFLLIHNPNQKPRAWHGWVIHGHKHNKNMRDYPFINGERKTINVTVELINYQPLNIGTLVSLGPNSIKRMRTIDSQPERW